MWALCLLSRVPTSMRPDYAGYTTIVNFPFTAPTSSKTSVPFLVIISHLESITLISTSLLSSAVFGVILPPPGLIVDASIAPPDLPVSVSRLSNTRTRGNGTQGPHAIGYNVHAMDVSAPGTRMGPRPLRRPAMTKGSGPEETVAGVEEAFAGVGVPGRSICDAD